MSPDEYQQAWQAESSQTRVTINGDILLKEVQRSQHNFRAMILLRDFREAGISILMIPVWFYLGYLSSPVWTWYLTVPALLWVSGFIIMDRLRHKQKLSEPGESLLDSVRESLAQVEHQIWLLRNILWWYLLPFAIPILIFWAHTSWSMPGNWFGAIAAMTIPFLLLFAVYGFIYWLNQYAVRKQLEPRRQELLALLTSLTDETANEVSGGYPILMNTEPVIFSLRRFAVGCLVSVVCLLIGLGGMYLAHRFSRGYAKKSPVAAGERSTSNQTTQNDDANLPLPDLIVRLRKEHKLVGLAAMVMVDGKVVASAVDGERKTGSGVKLAIGDQWHLGSITKSVTATMIARLVEAGKMHWSDTIGTYFPEASVNDVWKAVTLRQLLTHTAGAPANFSYSVMLKRPTPGPECSQARREAVLNVIADKPAYPPGTKFVYSNVDCTIAGAMAEKATGATWEDLVKREVFDPLGLKGAGFGPPKSSDEHLEQPRGHRGLFFGWKFAVDDKSDNTPIMGPAGIVHMTLEDLCTYATEHMRGELGEGKLLSAETYKLLHTPELEHYACGWVKNEPNAAIPHTEYWHNGSNTMWYALVVFIPDTKMVVAVTSNDGDIKNAEAAACEIVIASAKQIGAVYR